MKANIININGIKAVGMSYFGNNAKGEIKELWQAFNNSCDSINNKNLSQLCYGICDGMMDEQGRFNYTAAVEVDSFSDIPQGMEGKVVPEGKYAVYTYIGSIDMLGEFYNNIFSKWIIEGGYELDFRPQLEVYDERFMKNGEFDIYVPIK